MTNPAHLDGPLIAHNVDEEPVADNERLFSGWQLHLFFAFGVVYVLFHLLALNVYPMETWTFRLLHVAGALVLGYALMSAARLDHAPAPLAAPARGFLGLSAVLVGYSALCVIGAWAWMLTNQGGRPPAWLLAYLGPTLVAGVGIAIILSWLARSPKDRVAGADWVLLLASVVVMGFLLFSMNHLALRMRAGTPFADLQNAYVALAGVVLILELTRRVAGMALVVVTTVFLAYTFLGPYLPGFLNHTGYDWKRFFTYLYTDNGILGATTAVSSTYIILFIVFASFLQASKVGDYFVNFAFAIAGRSRGGPAKVAVFASGLMGMINGTSAGNVVATGSLTIPLMKRVGYAPQSAGAIEAAASTGGQIMPPIMGAGAFIMAEVTGIPYSELVIAAIIPATLYFVSIYFMVDLEAARTGMRGMREDELPKLRPLLGQLYLFLPIVMLMGALFAGYSVIRAGTYATIGAMVVSWFAPHKMTPKGILIALELAARMSIQIIVVCACAGIIVGVISLTGVGSRFSSMLLGIATSGAFSADIGLLLAMFFAMMIAIILGMGMPTTAAYAVAAAVVAPGLAQILLPTFAENANPERLSLLTAHFFVFYFAVVSAITPPVALASYAGAAIAGSNPMATSVTSFKLGLAAFIVPFMACYSPAILMEGNLLAVLQVAITSTVGVYLLAAAVQGYYFGATAWWMRLLLLVGALAMISGGWVTDLLGIAITVGLFLLQKPAKSSSVPTT